MITPRYEYSRTALRDRIQEFRGLASPYGLTVRYAMKANPHPDIIALVHASELHFDASSSYEAEALIQQGIAGSHISLSSQQSPHVLPRLLESGVLFVATSLKQLSLFLETEGRPDKVGIRINPNSGHGHNNRTTTGGINASFGIWHEYIDEVLKLTSAAGVRIDRLHLHVGSGADPKVWGEVMEQALTIAESLKDVVSLDIGGGYKVKRFDGETETDLSAVMQVFAQHLEAFKQRTGRGLALEIEPGTYAVAHAGTLVATIDDIVDTGREGHTFLRLNTGMNDFLRSALYGAQHRIEVMNDSPNTKAYVVVGHNCESGDIFTPAPGNPEELQPRVLNEARIGDEVRIYDVGAYCAVMSAKGYNSFPDAQEILID